jgi:micrococcal nuclease
MLQSVFRVVVRRAVRVVMGMFGGSGSRSTLPSQYVRRPLRARSLSLALGALLAGTLLTGCDDGSGEGRKRRSAC